MISLEAEREAEDRLQILPDVLLKSLEALEGVWLTTSKEPHPALVRIYENMVNELLRPYALRATAYNKFGFYELRIVPVG